MVGDGWTLATQGEYKGLELSLADGTRPILPCFGWAIGVGVSGIGKLDLRRAGGRGVPVPRLIV